MERKTALITGGSGYLGVHLAKELNQRGWRVITLDLKNPVEYFNVGYIGDVRDKDILTKIFKSDKIDTVFHLAGLKYEKLKFMYFQFRNLKFLWWL